MLDTTFTVLAIAITICALIGSFIRTIRPGYSGQRCIFGSWSKKKVGPKVLFIIPYFSTLVTYKSGDYMLDCGGLHVSLNDETTIGCRMVVRYRIDSVEKLIGESGAGDVIQRISSEAKSCLRQKIVNLVKENDVGTLFGDVGVVEAALKESLADNQDTCPGVSIEGIYLLDTVRDYSGALLPTGGNNSEPVVYNSPDGSKLKELIEPILNLRKPSVVHADQTAVNSAFMTPVNLSKLRPTVLRGQQDCKNMPNA